MERKITLMVFVLSSVLILSGFSASEKAFAQVVDPSTGISTVPGGNAPIVAQ